MNRQLTQQIERLSACAFRLAKRVYRNPESRSQGIDQASALLPFVTKIQDDLREVDDDEARSLLHLVSETFMDLDWVVHGGQGVSLRMGRLARYEKWKQSNPPTVVSDAYAETEALLDGELDEALDALIAEVSGPALPSSPDRRSA